MAAADGGYPRCMAIRDIRLFGDPILRTAAEPVTDFDKQLRSLVKDLTQTLDDAQGAGLAAPQIGVGLRVIVVDLSVGEDPSQLIQLVNPELLEREGEQRHEEGCLSIPGYGGSPTRPARVTVKGLDPDGQERVLTGTELLARAFSHEIDHVDGLVFVDRLSPLKRDLMKRKLRKRAREGWEE
jgi:peptide deformylase